MSDLYERDALAWAEQQAALLDRMATGERLNEVVDWRNVIEEVRDVGLSELRTCQSLLLQAVVHLLKLRATPDAQAAGHWREEAGAFLDDAAQRFTPCMRQRIDLEALYARALRRAKTMLTDAERETRWSEACPFVLDELLAGDIEALLAGTKLR